MTKEVRAKELFKAYQELLGREKPTEEIPAPQPEEKPMAPQSEEAPILPQPGEILEEKQIFITHYEVRDENSNVIQTLQTETWDNWVKMEEATAVVANQLGKRLGFIEYTFNVEASSKGLTYYFIQKSEVLSPECSSDTKVSPEEITPEEATIYTVTYEIRDGANQVLQVLQTETWTDWAKMEEATIVVANQFGKDLGFGEDKFNIDATPEGLTYYFVEGEQEDISSEDSSVKSTDETTSSSEDSKSEGSASSESDSVEETSEEESESKAKVVPGKKGPGKPGKMLPNTGDRSFFGAAALSFLAGFGLMAVRKSKKDA